MGNCTSSAQVKLVRVGPDERKIAWNGDTVDREIDDKGSEVKYSQPTPEELDLFGVSVHYLSNQFIKEVRDAGFDETSKIYQIEDMENFDNCGIIRRKGLSVTCPIDNEKGAAYVHSITDKGCTGKATIMLSYTWEYSIGDIIDTLVGYCQSEGLDPKNTFFWICCLCINQHRVVEKKMSGDVMPFDEFQSVLEDRIMSIGHILAIVAPWQTLSYLERAWCLLELFTADENDCKITIRMPSKDRRNFVNIMKSDNLGDQMNTMFVTLGSIDVRKAEASLETDRSNIMSLIEDGVGYDEFNLNVVGVVRTWALDVVESEVAARSRLEDENSKAQQGTLLNRVAELFHEIGEYDRSLAMGKEGIRVNESQYGRENQHTAKSIYLVGRGSYSKGNIEEAIRLEKQALAIRKRVLGQNNEETAESMMTTAGMLDWKGEKEEALKLYRDALAIHVKLFGREHAKTIESLSFIAILLDEKGEGDEALELYEDVVNSQEEVFGRESTNTATMISNIANALYEKGEKDRALELYKEVSQIYVKLLGSDHHLTTSTCYWIDRISREIGSNEKCVIM